MNFQLLSRFAIVLLGSLALIGCDATNISTVYGDLPAGVISSQPLQASQTIHQNSSRSNNWGNIPPLALPLPPGRDGQIFHNALRDRLSPSGLAQNPSYELVAQRFTVTSTTVQAQFSGNYSLRKYVVTFGYRVNRIDAEGKRHYLFGETLVIEEDYQQANTGSHYVDEPQETNAKRRALNAMADKTSLALQIQFSRLNLADE